MAEQTERDKLLTQSYSMATTRLRDEYKDRFNELRTQAAAELGIEWSPKMSAEQRAEQEIEALLAQFPHLRDRFREEVPTE